MNSKLLFLLLLTINLSAQDFYDINTIQSIKIEFEQSNWDALLDAEKAGDENYILAKSVTINGETFDSIGVKYKGNSTYQPNQTKNPFHIELDTYKDHEYQGYTDIKLSNVAKDPSFVREVLSYQILRQYMDAPQSNYANVYVNDELIGLYSNSEAISKKFVDNRFGSKSNTFIKCNPPEGAGPQSSNLPNLEYLGPDSTSYLSAYEIKSDEGWQDLIELCNILANETENLDQVLDIDRTLWMLAFNNVLVNLDSYSGRFAQNYYLYKGDNGRFLPVVWDLNESLGVFSDTGNGRLNNTNSKIQMDILLHENDSDFPLLQKLLSNDTYRKMYLAHCKTILLENFDNNNYIETGQNLQALIDNAVQEDDNKFFTYNNFSSNLQNDILSGGGPGGTSSPGIAPLMDGRNSYLISTPELSATQPAFLSVDLFNEPILGQTITVTANITDANSAILGYRNNDEQVFAKVPMYDDGNHNDGSANDGVFGADIILAEVNTQYFIYAENDDLGMFSPRRAEYEFHTITAGFESVILGDLVINEFSASNDALIADQDGEFDDWIELYNNGSSTIDLSGYSLSDDPTDTTKWIFPDEVIIGPNEYLLIWADDDEDQEGLHTNFKLSAAEESISIWDNNGELVDQIIYADQRTDITFGRFPNGTGDFKFMLNATPNAENDGTSNTENIDLKYSLDVFPNPTSGFINVVNLNNSPTDIFIINMTGQVIDKMTILNKTTINTSDWMSGIYFIKSESEILKIIRI